MVEVHGEIRINATTIVGAVTDDVRIQVWQVCRPLDNDARWSVSEWVDDHVGLAP